MKFTERKIDDATAVKVRFQTSRLSSRPWQKHEELLVIEFESQIAVARKDISYVLGMTSAAKEIWRPTGIVFDLRSLRYEWGDTMQQLFQKFPSEQSFGLVGGYSIWACPAGAPPR
jgi:hypothetical protein